MTLKPHSASVTTMHEYSLEERKLLLELARQSITARIRKETLSMEAPSAHLAEPRGAFTTLHIQGRLRGCIGYVLPETPLYLTILETAVSAAFDDPRFLPVRADEAPHLEIEISVLTPPTPIKAAEVEVGRHGLLVSQHGRRGLLLPQVPLEWDWDREQFLAETCRKAGLPTDAWKRGAHLEAFTAEIFGDANFADLNEK